MKYGVNRFTLVGNVGEVPKVSEREGEAIVANFPLATNEFYKNKEEGGSIENRMAPDCIYVWDIISQFV